MNKTIILTGTVTEGFESIGPFNSQEEADNFGNNNLEGQSWETMDLISQTEYAGQLRGVAAGVGSADEEEEEEEEEED